ncbi:MAG: TonB-dependent receptor [Candidatus Eremiobacteraeota bacterium]|nr:TonB-dependent receptor [Candidatus Eremiobacteraeota bacterium]
MALPDVIAAAAACALSGTVHGDDGAPVRAHVVAAGPATRATDADAQGRFSLELPCGRVRITVSARGYASSDVDVDATGSNRIDVLLDSAGGGRLRQIGRVTVDGRLAVPHGTVPTRTITRAEMDAQGFDRVVQALAQVPSLTLTRPDGGATGATTVVSLRGPDPSETRIALDGQPLNDTNTGDFDLATFPTTALSAIDVSEGLGAEDARGSDTIGGEVNLVSLRPTAQPMRTVRLSLGSYGASSAELNATGRHGRFGYAVALGDEQRRGFVHDYPVSMQVTDANGNPQTVTTILGSAFSARSALANLTYDFSPRSTLRLRTLTVDDVRDESASQTAPADPANGAPGALFVGSGPELASHSLRATLASLSVPLGAGTLVASGAFSSSTRAVARSIDTGEGTTPYDPSLIDKLGSMTLEWTHATETSSVALGAQTRAETLLSPDQFGAGALHEFASQLWVRAGTQLTPRVRLAASLVDSAWSTFPASLDGRAGIALDGVAGGTLRFAVGTGFRAPLLAEKFVFPLAALVPDANCVGANGNANERAEHATEYELGYGRRFGATTADLTLYRTNLRDPIENFYPFGATCNPPGVSRVEAQSFPVNVGNVVYRGGALRLAHVFGPGYWTASAEYGVNAAYPTSLPDFVSAANPTSGSSLVPGQQFAGIPLQQYAVSVRYARGRTHGALAFAGKSANNELAQGRFATLDAALGRTWGRADVTLAGTNLTNAVSGSFTRIGLGTPYPTPLGLQPRDALVLEPAAVRLILTLR